MKSVYFLHSAVNEAWYFEAYYYSLLKQQRKYKVLKEEYFKPSVWYIEKFVGRYKYVSLRPYKKGEAIAIL